MPEAYVSHCWENAGLSAWMPGNCPYDTQSAQTASYQSDALGRWAEIWTAHVLSTIVSWAKQVSSGASINRLLEGGWVWGLKSSFHSPFLWDVDMTHSSASTGCVFVVFALDYLHERRKPTGSSVVGDSTVIPTQICPVDFVQRKSQQGKPPHQIPLRR